MDVCSAKVAINAPLTHYSIAPHVSYCRTEDGLVLMDLKRGKYFGLDEESAQMLDGFILSTPGLRQRDLQLIRSADASRGLAESLVRQGILDVTEFVADLTPPTVSAVDGSIPKRVSVRAHHIVRFLKATLYASYLLKNSSSYHIARRIRKRRTACRVFEGQDNLVRLIELAGVFRLLRPLFYTAKDKCLFDSIAFIEFCAQYRLFPTWVVGVTTQPFLAHSWVQEKTAVLNDTAERARRYTPILAA